MTEVAAPDGFRVEPSGSDGASAAAQVLEACLVEAWPAADIEALLASGRGLL